jgi:hypothetical protein
MSVLAAKFHSLRSKVLGLGAVQQRFDVLQVKVDGLQQGVRDTEHRFDATLQGAMQRLEQRLDALAKTATGVAALRQSVARLEHKLERAQAGAPAAASGRHRPAGGERLAFLVHSLELVNHFGCVWDLMEPGSFDVVLHGAAAEGPQDIFQQWECAVLSSAEVLATGERYDWLVSNHPVELGEQPLVRRLAARQVRFMYAAGKTGWNLADWNNVYDVILCFGPYHAAKFAGVSDAVVVQMGYPRFDRYFQSQPERAALCARYGCDPARRTVVWLPTWKSLSSVGHYDEEISALTRSFNVVVKLHPLMVEEEPERVAALRRHPLTCLITDASDNLPLYQLADAMLFDYGGPPLAGVYADKDMLLLNVPGAESDEIAGADSPDMTIREQLASVNPGENRIAALLSDPLVWERQAPARRALRTRYFAPHYGFSADVAAGALSRLPQLLAFAK